MAVDEEAFLARLPRSDNPEAGFVGSVDDPGGGLPPEGYGVYERPVASTLRSFGLETTAGRDGDLDLLRRAVEDGRPVIVWAISGLGTPPAVTLSDALGRSFAAARGEHTFIVIGFDAGRIRLLDPATGEAIEVSATRFDASWAVLGRRSVVPCWPPRAR